MVDNILTLHEYKHPNKEAEKQYDSLIAIDENKKSLLTTLSLLLDNRKIETWKNKFHSNGFSLLNQVDTATPLIILSGEVGCGKTALAHTIGTPLAKQMDTTVKVFETPSNIRGSGLVGEISNRITEAFENAKAKLKDKELGILIIDEADDIATSRSQNQAHHEDRAGLNVLIKQIDSIRRAGKNLAVILITNRISVLDPAVRRRTTLHLQFDRPTGNKLEEVIRWIFDGIKYDAKDYKKLIVRIESNKIPYSFSDLIHRIGKQAIFNAIERNTEFNITIFNEVLDKVEPSPLIETNINI